MRGPVPSDFELAGAGPGPPAGSYRLVAIEVTQSIQNLAHSVPLVAGKTTVVRAYLNRPDGPVTVRGELEALRPGGPPVAVPSMNTLALDPAGNGDLTAKRLNLSSSLNFQLPDALTAAGGCTFRLSAVHTADTGETLSENGSASVTAAITFVAAPPLRMKLIAFRYQTGNPPVDHEPAARDYAMIESWLRRAYPISQILLNRITVQGMKPWPNDAMAVNVQLTAMRNADLAGGGDALAHYFGLVADSGGFMRGLASVIPNQPDPSAVASGPTGTKFFPWDTDGCYGDWYTGHELGHTFGRPHVGSGCGDGPRDASYPYPAGQLTGPENEYVGFDAGDPALGLPMAVYSGIQYHDLMSYCAYIWISAYTYRCLLDRLVSEAGAHRAITLQIAGFAMAENMPEEEAKKGEWLNVVGTVNFTSGTGKIQVLQPLSAVELPQGKEERAGVQLFDAAGMLLGNYPARVKMEMCRDREEDEIGIVDTFVPRDPQTARLDLMVNGQPVDSRTVPGSGAITGFALAEAAHSYTIQVSPDDGATWQTVAVGVAQPEYEVRRRDFPNARALRVRVLASDGFKVWPVREHTIE